MNLLTSLRAGLVAAALVAAASGTAPAHGAELVVGAPSELVECTGALSSAFLAREKGSRLRFVTAPSDDLYAKIESGEPIDVYMSSQMALQGQMLADGKMVYDSWTMYATGRLVLWAADPRFDVTKGLRLLADPAVKRVATVDAGSAYLLPTLTVLHSAGVLEKFDSARTDSPSMQAAVKAVQAGKAQVAILSYETVLAAPMKGVGKYALIPESAYKDEFPGHAAVVTMHGAKNALAYRFIQFLKSAEAQAILVPKGFMKPPLGSVDVR
ncbi:molybdate ABC transporter substrate-binding protein [Massilia sp. METH4]|uniref:molybdate ABC transporter substrate-binding protein n=1 Tax=Massilia sp. METH4 TaxID=3123041 RepID=UPI0030D5A582